MLTEPKDNANGDLAAHLALCLTRNPNQFMSRQPAKGEVATQRTKADIYKNRASFRSQMC